MTAHAGEENLPHRPVLYQEILQALSPARKRYADLTVGAGGHAWGLLDASRPDGQLLGFDRDPNALVLAEQRLAEFNDRATLVHASYTSLSEQLARLGWDGLDGIVLDLGASSMQFDTASRGFSFLKQGPLDMRFDPTAPFDAANIVNDWDERALADTIYKYGEERAARRIARAIVKARPITDTHHLAEVITEISKHGRYGGRRSRIHPATRTFQALRIAVNGELDAVESVLPQALAALNPNGRLAVISFHSLEDRIVKRFFRQASQDQVDPEQPFSPVMQPATIRRISRKPITAGEEEIQTNPRARSAKLRVIEKI